MTLMVSDLTTEQVAELLLRVRSTPAAQSPKSHRMSPKSGACMFCGLLSDTSICEPKLPRGETVVMDTESRRYMNGRGEHPSMIRLRAFVAAQN